MQSQRAKVTSLLAAIFALLTAFVAGWTFSDDPVATPPTTVAVTTTVRPTTTPPTTVRPTTTPPTTVPPTTVPPTTAPPTTVPPTTVPPTTVRPPSNQAALLLNDGLNLPTQIPGRSEGSFRMACRGGQLNYDDPIVAPGVKNATHLHQWFGNLDGNYATTDANIATGSKGSTCQGGTLNDTAYWVPALIDSQTKQVVPIDVVIIYYKGEPHHSAGPVQPLPAGLRMISNKVSWSCGGNVIGSCGDTTTLIGKVNFKWCWNGQLDSPDHKSHLADSSYVNGVERCPATHPTVIPRITYNVIYNRAGMGPTSGFYLSSDWDPKMTGMAAGTPAAFGSTYHGDYLEGWKDIDSVTGKTFSRVWYDNCLAGYKNCDFGDLGDGRRLKPYPPEATPQQPSPAPSPLYTGG